MKVKLEKKLWCRADFGFLNHLGEDTKTHYVFGNVSTADIERLVFINGHKTDGILIKSRHVKRFVSYDDTEWRG